MGFLERLDNKDPLEDRDYQDRMDNLALRVLQAHPVYRDQQGSREAQDLLDLKET